MHRLAKILNNIQIFRTNAADYLRYLIGFLHVKIFLVVLSAVNIMTWVGILYIDKKINDDQIALHYNVDFGIDYYGDISNIYIIPLLGLFFILFNLLLLGAVKQNKDFRFLSYLLLSIALIANIILIVSAVSIFIINY